MASEQGIEGSFTTSDGGELRIGIGDEATFEALRDALGDPVWLVGATWQVLTTNDFKRGRFVDAFGAWAARQDHGDAATLLRTAGVAVD